MSQLLARFAVPLGLAAITLQSALYDVPGGYRAVMFDRFSGVRNEATSEGTHFLVPWLQRAILYDVRVKPRVSGGSAGGEGRRRGRSSRAHRAKPLRRSTDSARAASPAERRYGSHNRQPPQCAS